MPLPTSRRSASSSTRSTFRRSTVASAASPRRSTRSGLARRMAHWRRSAQPGRPVRPPIPDMVLTPTRPRPSPSAEAPTPERRAQHRRRMRIRRGPFALAIACVVLFVFGLTDTLVTQVRLHHAQVRLTETRDAMEQTSAQLAAVQHELESTIATKNQDLATNTQILDQLSAAQGQLSQAKQGLSSENFTVSNVDSCIKGVEGAIGALQGGSRAAAVSSLQGASVPCETIEEDENPGGPVYPYDFPDPDVIEVGGTYYAYGTNTASGNVQIITSTDLAHWTLVGNALPQLASWATPGYTWAPSVIEDNGTFLLYYTVATYLTECVSVASASRP